MDANEAASQFKRNNAAYDAAGRAATASAIKRGARSSVRFVAKWAAIAAAAVGFFLIVGNIAANRPSRTDASQGYSPGSLLGCTQRGLAYYVEIGAYPTLSDGRSADSVIAARCDRSTTAF